ncbi:MAG: hypothetical protein AABW67_05210 [Nanoarchaeota archaeon]
MRQFIFTQKEVENLVMSEKIERARQMLQELDRMTDRNIITKVRRMMSIQEALSQLRGIGIEY